MFCRLEKRIAQWWNATRRELEQMSMTSTKLDELRERVATMSAEEVEALWQRLLQLADDVAKEDKEAADAGES